MDLQSDSQGFLLGEARLKEIASGIDGVSDNTQAILDILTLQGDQLKTTLKQVVRDIVASLPKQGKYDTVGYFENAIDQNAYFYKEGLFAVAVGASGAGYIKAKIVLRGGTIIDLNPILISPSMNNSNVLLFVVPKTSNGARVSNFRVTNTHASAQFNAYGTNCFYNLTALLENKFVSTANGYYSTDFSDNSVKLITGNLDAIYSANRLIDYDRLMDYDRSEKHYYYDSGSTLQEPQNVLNYYDKLTSDSSGNITKSYSGIGTIIAIDVTPITANGAFDSQAIAQVVSYNGSGVIVFKTLKPSLTFLVHITAYK